MILKIRQSFEELEKRGGALCYETTKKCSQASPMVTPLQCFNYTSRTILLTASIDPAK